VGRCNTPIRQTRLGRSASCMLSGTIRDQGIPAFGQTCAGVSGASLSVPSVPSEPDELVGLAAERPEPAHAGRCGDRSFSQLASLAGRGESCGRNLSRMLSCCSHCSLSTAARSAAAAHACHCRMPACRLSGLPCGALTDRRCLAAQAGHDALPGRTGQPGAAIKRQQSAPARWELRRAAVALPELTLPNPCIWRAAPC